MKVFDLFCFILILIASIPFAVYVWPTKYAYDHIKMGEYDYPVRIHRVTGAAECLTPIGWFPLHASTTPPNMPRDLFGNPITATPTPNPR